MTCYIVATACSTVWPIIKRYASGFLAGGVVYLIHARVRVLEIAALTVAQAVRNRE